LVEGYGGRNFKNDYIRFITFALASNDETIDYLETLYETESVTDDKIFKQID
jgi:four helix bundle protein